MLENKERNPLPTLPIFNVNDSDACGKTEERKSFKNQDRRARWMEEGTFIRFDAQGRTQGHSLSIGGRVCA